MSQLIEDYALIGDGHSAALVALNGSIDWLCWPRFDSDACFAALLGTEQHGHWSIAPTCNVQRVSRRYLPDTLILETSLHTDDGVVNVVDFMPIRDGAPTLARVVIGMEGRVPLCMKLRLRLGYGLVPPWMEKMDDGVVGRLGPDLLAFRCALPVDIVEDAATASFTVEQGQRVAFTLSHGVSWEPPPPALDTETALAATQRNWRDWMAGFDDAKTRWPEAVRRSLLTLKALVYEPSGGLVAAPTTSLPETPGGSMNWDYRYCWLRDSAFTLGALLNAGFQAEATKWRDWLVRAVGGAPEHVRIMYRVDGGRHLDEWCVDRLPGFRHAKPIRIGNAASTQHQIDALGEVLDGLSLARRAGIPVSEQEKTIAAALARHIAATWTAPGSGIWESRGELRHYTYSKVMAWAGLDRYVRDYGQDPGTDQQEIAQLADVRDAIHSDVCRQAWNDGLNSFTQYYGGEQVDASLLLLPMVGFLAADEPRMASTIAVVARELGEGGLIRRKKRLADGPDEGAFLACSFWMADCLRLQGRHDEAVAQFERVLALANDVGLLAEEYEVPSRRQTGNFPQALTHLALVNTALGLSGPVLERGGP